MREPLRRIFDVAVSATVLLLTSPIVLGALIAIRLESKGHPIYRQRRVGKDGAPFDVLKLRTMVPPAEGATHGAWTAEDDPRVTRVGRILRRSHLDELPQVLNILRGDLSVVGPRPEQPHYVAVRPCHPPCRGPDHAQLVIVERTHLFDARLSRMKARGRRVAGEDRSAGGIPINAANNLERVVRWAVLRFDLGK